MTAPVYFTLDPTTSPTYLEAVLIDAGIPIKEAAFIAVVAHDSDQRDASKAGQRQTLQNEVDAYNREAAKHKNRADAIVRIIEQFYGDDEVPA